MPLLLSSRLPRVKKLAEGGSIPVYGSYQYKDAQQVPYNTASLLSKYQSTPVDVPAQAAETKSYDDVALDGLDNDLKAFSNKRAALVQALQDGTRNNPNFESSPAGLEVHRQLGYLTTAGVQIMKNRKDVWKSATTTMENNKAASNWFYTEARGGMVRDQSGNLKYIRGEELNLVDDKNQRLYTPVTYAEAANLVATEDDNAFIGQRDITAALSNGYGTEMINKQIVDVLNNAGMTSTSQTVELNGVKYDNADLKRDANSYSHKSNSFQLENAYKVLLSDLMDTPAWDSLKSRAYTIGGAKDEKDALNWVRSYLAQQIAIQTSVDVSESEIKEWDTPGINDGSGGSGDGSNGPLGELSQYVIESAGMGEPTKETMEIVNPDSKKARAGDYTVAMTLETWKVPKADELKDSRRPVSENKDLNKVVDIDEIILPNGMKLTDIKDSYKQNLSNVALPYDGSGSTMKLTYIPMLNGKPLDIPAVELDGMNLKLEAIQKRLDDNKELWPVGSPKWLELQKEMKLVQQNVLGKYKGAYIQKYYIMDIVFNMDHIDEGSAGYDYLKATSTELDQKESLDILDFTNDDEHELYINTPEGKDPYVYSPGLQDHFDSWGGETIKRTTVLMPVKDLASLQSIDGKVYTDKFNLTVGSLGLNPGNLKYGLTAEELRKATVSSKGGVYHSLYELNKVQ